MSKLLDVTKGNMKDFRKQMLKEFTKMLSGIKAGDTKIDFSRTFGETDQRAKVIFDELAWIKMQALIMSTDKEIGWHGLAKRSEDDDFTYEITDILVYPQEVSAARVTTDQGLYDEWLMDLDDEIFPMVRMHGHSHVNMGVSPSTTDRDFYNGVCDKLRGDMFYIFMIWNKSGQRTIEIHDLKHNLLFENADCDVEVYNDDIGVETLLEEVKDKVKEKIQIISGPDKTAGYKSASYVSGYQGTNPYSCYSYTSYPKKGSLTEQAIAYSKKNEYGRYYDDLDDLWGDY